MKGATVDEYVVEAGKSRGTWQLKLVNCSKRRCRRCGGTQYKHGPYWYRFDGRRWHYMGRNVNPRALREQLDLDLGTAAREPDAVLLGKAAKHGRRRVTDETRRRGR